MDTKETICKKIEKMADFQMRKSTHMNFLENCVSEGVSPKGLKLTLKVQVGTNQDELQSAVDRILAKTSLEITKLVAEEHYRKLQESKPKMNELEDKLRSILKDEGQMNNISHEVFLKTETKKNSIVERQRKKLETLLEERDTLQSEKMATNTKSKAVSQKSQTRIVMPVIQPEPKRNKKTNSQTTKPNNQSKNENPPGSKKPTYSEAIRRGQNVKQTNNKNQTKNKEKQQNNKVGHPLPQSPMYHREKSSNQQKMTRTTTNPPRNNWKIVNNRKNKNMENLEKTLNLLVKHLQELKETGDSSKSQAGRTGGNKRRYGKK